MIPWKRRWIKNTLTSLEKDLEIKAADENPYDEQIIELKATAVQEIDWNYMNELVRVKDHQEFLYKLLTNKDSFVRKRIIDQNLAFLNQRLTYYLDKIGLPHTVEFQNDLTVIITQLGQDLDFDNLSRGERNRLILSLSWAFRDVWENLYHSINLLFIDELVDSGMDASGVESSIAVLKRMTRERDKNVFLISHRDDLTSRVNHVLKVIKENGFTSYSNDVEIIEWAQTVTIQWSLLSKNILNGRIVLSTRIQTKQASRHDIGYQKYAITHQLGAWKYRQKD